MEMYRTSETRHLYCINWDDYEDELEVFGNETDEITYQRFEWVIVPCNYIHSDVGDVGDTVSEECIRDQKK